MASKAPLHNIDESRLTVTKPITKAVEIPAAVNSLKISLEQMASGKAHFTGNDLGFIKVPEGRLVLQTLHSHNQYSNTTYGKDDRYRGIRGGRRAVLVNEADTAELGFRDCDIVHLISEFRGTERRAENFRIVSYSAPKGCAAARYPETNVLVPLDSVADTRGTPTSNSVIVRLERAEA
ncbi:anaerobic selenocysteine-containing dehydrogenase [Arthrobacter sp. MP_M7]|nr:anaerobic selenocysteine-containing dehydrogenase [Arthrobacter sp. MP_M4]MEC5203886.1 anaerobic selenocysteine-containing dehydrogenase [Arthrobacter sp. MP_M7]